MAAKTFEDLVVWQEAHAFVLSVYRLSSRFPREEVFGLTSQLRRAAVSVPANIAEGFKRAGKPDKLRFYNMAQASGEECRYHRDLGYAETCDALVALDEVTRMLDAYMATFRPARAQARVGY